MQPKKAFFLKQNASRHKTHPREKRITYREENKPVKLKT